jgi:translation initiation factor 5B
MYIFGAVLLCTILPSQVAFFSLVSAGGVPTIAAYGLIALLRLTMTPNNFKHSYFFLGKYRRLFYLVAALFNGLVVAVSFLYSKHLLLPKIAYQGYDFPFLLPHYSGKF